MTSKKQDSGSQFSKETLAASAERAAAEVETAGSAGVALVEAWIQNDNAAAIQEVAERGSGPTRKAARRGLNILKSRGVAIPEQRRVASLANRASETKCESWMIPPDSMGVALFVFASGAKSERSKACFVFVRDDQNVMKIENGELSQSKLRDAMTRASGGSDNEPVKVPLDWARGRVATARAAHTKAGHVEPLGFRTAQELLEPAPETAPSHPFDEEGFEFSDEDAKSLTQDSADLHQMPEFRSWVPDSNGVQELLGKIGERVGGGEKPSDEQMKQIVDEEIGAATDRYFTPEVRDQLAHRMKDAALSVLARDGEAVALKVAAALQVIQRAGLVTDPPNQVPFLKAFFQKAMSILIAQGGGNLRVPVPNPPANADAPADATDSPA